MIAAEAEGDRLTQAELLSTVTLLFVAGFETTMNLLGNGMLALLRNPGEIDRLRADPSLVRSGVEELIRFDGPVHITARIATCAVEIGGEQIQEGEQVAVWLGAANRDPEQFPDPTGSTLAARPTGTWASAAAPTSASARPWPASRPRPRSPPSSAASPTSSWPPRTPRIGITSSSEVSTN